MARKLKKESKPKKLTDAQRSERFKDMARELGAEDEAPGFDRTLERLAQMPKDAGGSESGNG